MFLFQYHRQLQLLWCRHPSHLPASDWRQAPAADYCCHAAVLYQEYIVACTYTLHAFLPVWCVLVCLLVHSSAAASACTVIDRSCCLNIALFSLLSLTMYSTLTHTLLIILCFRLVQRFPSSCVLSVHFSTRLVHIFLSVVQGCTYRCCWCFWHVCHCLCTKFVILCFSLARK